MNKNTKCLVIFFDGEYLSGDAISECILALASHNAGNINASLLDYGEMVKSVAQSAYADCNAEVKCEHEYNAEENAVIYIGTIFKDILGATYKTEDFVAALTQKISEARIKNDESSKRFMNALFILSQENLSISQSLLKKYRLNEKKILIIKRVYNLVASIHG